MKEIYSTLKELQGVLAQMFEIEDKIKEIPKALADKEAALQKTKISYLEDNEKCERVKKELKELRTKLDEAGIKRETCEQMMETITQAREFETLQKEIEEAKNTEQSLRKSLLAKEKYYEEQNAKLSAKEEIMAMQNQEVEEETKVKDSLIAENQAVLDEIKAKRDELAKDLDPNTVFKFERIIRNKGGIGIVPIQAKVCTGCHMRLPLQFVNDVRHESNAEGDEVMYCPYCSRVLYYDETVDSSADSAMFATNENLLDSSADDEEVAFPTEEDEY
jgi:uncharacterized protein